MILVDSERMRIAESRVMEVYRVDEELLMEVVATRVADKIAEFIGDIREKMFLIFAGRGKNGGDAIAIGRHLILKGAEVRVLIVKRDEEDISPLTRIQLDRLKELSPKAILESREELPRGDFVVDGIFGTGFRGELRDPYASIVRHMNSLGLPIISIDVPSGLDAGTGKVSDECVKARYTFTLGLPKLGLYIYPGAEYAGEIHIIHLGFPLDRYIERNYELIDEELIRSILPHRKPDSHKGTYGRVGCLLYTSPSPRD